MSALKMTLILKMNVKSAYVFFSQCYITFVKLLKLEVNY